MENGVFGDYYVFINLTPELTRITVTPYAAVDLISIAQERRIGSLRKL